MWKVRNNYRTVKHLQGRFATKLPFQLNWEKLQLTIAMTQSFINLGMNINLKNRKDKTTKMAIQPPTGMTENDRSHTLDIQLLAAVEKNIEISHL